MKREPKNIAASIQARLLQHSHELNVEHQLTLARFGGERLLYRLSKSEFADRFILKGAALLLLWMGDATRPTKDIDLLGFGDTSAETLNKIFVALCEVEAPDDDDETRLLRAANPHLRGILVAMLDTCCRPGEILSLQWGDVDMASRELVVRAEKAKTRRARRLPMSTRLHAVLQMRRTGADGVDFGPEAFVFGDATGQRVTSIRTAWEAAREPAGLADLHLADLRHEAASRLEDAGVPTTYVSKFLGHRNLSTTTRYLKATIRGLRLAVEKLEESRRNAARKSKKSVGLAIGLQTEGATHSKRDSRSRESSPPKSLTS